MYQFHFSVAFHRGARREATSGTQVACAQFPENSLCPFGKSLESPTNS